MKKGLAKSFRKFHENKSFGLAEKHVLLIMEKLLRKVPFHFVLIAFYPFLGLYIHNAQQIPAYAGSRALVFSAVLMLLVYLVCLVLLRHFTKAALLSSLILLLFYTYGHLYDLLSVNIPPLAHHALLAVLYILILLAVFIVLLRAQSSLDNINAIINSVALLLIVMTMGEALVMYLNGQWFAEVHEDTVKKTVPTTASVSSTDQPDVYYFLLDSYARQDELLAVENYDNSLFIEQLKQRGFNIPACTQSNYDNTLESVASSLNMNYLDALGVDTDADGDAEMALTSRLIQHNIVRSKFIDRGYTTYAFATKAPFVNLSDSDYYYDVNARTSYLDRLETLNFYELFLNTTALRLAWQTELHHVLLAMPLNTIQWIEPQLDTFSTGRYHEYLQNEYSLKQLMSIPAQPGPKFIYAHLMNVHSSYVYKPDGSFMIQTDESKAAYVNQVAYLNGRLIKIIDQILTKSKVPPIIILQGDHNNENEIPTKVRILNAYYLPQNGNHNLPDDISPVNSFRWVFNYYFHDDYLQLENRSYYRDPDGKLLPVESSCINR